MELLSNYVSKITVLSKQTGEEIAVITNDELTTATPDILVKLSFD